MKRRSGFTLIELLVVIGIVLVLGAVAFTAFRGVLGSQERGQTKMILSNAQSMLAEYDGATSLRRQPTHMWNPNNTVAAGGSFDIWRDADPANAAAGTAGMEGLVAPKADLNDDPNRLKLPAVKNAQVVFNQFLAVPGARKLLSALPSDRQVKLPDDALTTTGTVPPNGYDESATPALLDAWNNPIIFVPASGLRGVTLADGATPFTVTNAKVYPDTGTGSLADGNLPPNARPFFASAGADGDFSKGDDNQYSFEQ